VPYFNNLLVRLYAAIAIFGIMIYAIFYMINSPMKRSLGFGSIDAFSLMFQDWVFDISVGNAFNPKFGQPTDISVDTLVFKSKKGIRGIMFLPYIHYGPAGSIGGSMFPHILEDYARRRYGSVSFIMHPGVNVDFNPVASSQAAALKKALDDGVANAVKMPGKFSYIKGLHGDSHVDRLRFGDSELDIISRAPRVTEDVSPEAAAVIKGAAESEGIKALIVDAHNSRYETAPKEELDGVGFNSKQQQEYVDAIKSGEEVSSSERLRAGFACESIFAEMNEPQDIADGMMNAAVFGIGAKSYALLQFNANNMLPALRNQIVKHLKAKYGIDAEVCTTDTHAVNSLGMTASNVLGRSTTFSELKPYIDSCIKKAMESMEDVDVLHSRGTVKNFKVWGRNVQDKIATVLDSVIAMGRIVIPAIIVGGFIAAIWIVSLV
jgi:predicted neutral ceramidase superfamily lipid hydrolase